MTDSNTTTEWHVGLASRSSTRKGENALQVIEFVDEGEKTHQRRTYEVTVKATETEFRLTSIRVFADDVKLEHLRQVPLTQLRNVAFEFVQQTEERLEGGEPLEDIMSDPFFESGEMMPGDRVSVHEFKRAYRDAAAAQGSSRRRALAEQFHVSVYTIDKWVRFARENGAIPKPERNTPQTPNTKENS